MKRLITGLDKNLGPYFVALFVGTVFSGLSVLGPTISGNMISAFIENTGSGMHYLILYLMVGLLQIVFSLLDSYACKSFAIKQKAMMRRSALRFFSKNDSVGKEKINIFSSFINNDIPALVEQYFSGTIDIVKCIFLLGLSAISMLSVHVVLALIVLVASLLIVLCPAATRKSGVNARKAYSEALGKYNTGLQSLLEGLRVVISYGYYNRANEIQQQHNKIVADKEHRLVKNQMAVQAMSSFLQIGKTIMILIVGAILISKGQMNIGGIYV